MANTQGKPQSNSGYGKNLMVRKKAKEKKKEKRQRKRKEGNNKRRDLKDKFLP